MVCVCITGNTLKAVMTLESLGLGPSEAKCIPLLGTQHYRLRSETAKPDFVSRRN